MNNENSGEIPPLKWNHFPGAEGWHIWVASTPVAQYMIKQFGDKFRWDFAYYHRSQSEECESLEAGMEAASDHWTELVRQIISPRGPEGTIIQTEPFEE